MSSADRSNPGRSRPAVPPASAPRQPESDEQVRHAITPDPSLPTAPDRQRLAAAAARRADAARLQLAQIRSARVQAQTLAARTRTWMEALTRQLLQRSQHDAEQNQARVLRAATAQAQHADQQRAYATTRITAGNQRVARTTSVAHRIRALVERVRKLPASPASGSLADLQHHVSDARHRRSWLGEQIARAQRQVQRCRDVAASITNLLVLSRHQAGEQTPSTATDHVAVTTRHTHAQEAETALTHARTPIAAAQERLALQQMVVAPLQEAIAGIRTSGFGSYLSRASPAVRTMIQDVHAEAQADGKNRAGRPPAQGAQDERQRRAERAAKAQARRHSSPSPAISGKDRICTPASQPPTSLPVVSKDIDPAVSGSRPVRRNHDEALANLPAQQALRYAIRLQESRRIGHAAAVSDAAAGALPAEDPGVIYRPAHRPFELKQGACLIAVRGGNAIDFALRMEASQTTLEDWLGEPAILRNLLVGSKARLKNVAGQIIAAWSPELYEAAAKGDLDIALAHQVDQLIARLGLHGHRVAAYLHLDSESGHPHLHINFARVRDDDLSLWSLEGRQRAAALWLHGRSNTVRLRGAEALADDVDALGASSPAARAAELLMSSDHLSATRTSTNGHAERINLQGAEAALRVTAVGRCPNALGGGVWKFGLGEDPQDIRKWRAEVRQATRAGNEQRLAALRASKPKVRGYWLVATKDNQGRYELRYREGYGWYLARKKSAQTRKSA